MILFHTEETDFVFKKKALVKKWLTAVTAEESCRVGDINVIFCSDNYLLAMNRQYLNHDYYTDVITFDYVEGNRISGDIFISVDTVSANAVEYGATFADELLRVIVHGVLHLIGYDDHEESDKVTMRAKEDYYLNIYREKYDCKQV